MSDHNTALLYQILHAQEHTHHLIGNIMTQLEQLAADVAAQTTVIASAQTLLTSLHSQLSDAFKQITENGDASALQAIIRDVEANTAALSAAVSANTVADTGAVSPVPVDTSAAPGTSELTPVAAPAGDLEHPEA